MSRQIPIETVFRSNGVNSWRDPLKSNRIHFRFPDSWTNTVGKDSIIGIRNLFITKGFRKAELTLSITLYGDDVDNGDDNIEVANEKITVHKFFDDSIVLKDYIMVINTKLKELEPNFKKFKQTFQKRTLQICGIL